MQEMIDLIRNGGVVILPTDTIYGLHADAMNPHSIEKIYTLKKRNSSKPLIVLVSDLSDLQKFDVYLNEVDKKVLSELWSEGVSVVLPCDSSNFEYLHRGHKKIAFRRPKKNDLLDLLRQTGPLVSTSANLENMPYAKDISEAREYFGDKVDLYVNGGRLEANPSRVYDLEEETYLR